MENGIMSEEYHQMTLSEWVEIKNELQRELQNVAESFVRIGYQLRRIRDDRLYEQDGYKNITEFAQKEYGLSPSVTSRFMAINERYSVDGYSKYLLPEYTGYGQSKLTEMLALPAEDMEMVTPQMQRADIRDLKDFNRQDPEAGAADDRYQLFEEFYKADPEAVDALYAGGASECCAAEEMKELLNPSGSRTFRKGLFFVSFTESDIKIKKFGGQPESLSYEELRSITDAIFAGDHEGGSVYAQHFGVEEKTEDKTDGESGASGEHESHEVKDAGNSRQGDKEQGEDRGDVDPAVGELEDGLPAGGGSEQNTEGAERDDRQPGEDTLDQQEKDEGNTVPQPFAPAQIEDLEDQKADSSDGFMNPPEEAENKPEIRDPAMTLDELGYKISKKLTEVRKLADQKKFKTAYVEATYLIDLLKAASRLSE